MNIGNDGDAMNRVSTMYYFLYCVTNTHKSHPTLSPPS